MTIDAEKAAPTAPETRTEKTHRRTQLSEGARAERRLGWMLIAPAVIVMIAVTAYPIGYAIYLSLQRYDLRFPKQAKFVGLDNYTAVLSSPYWWHALWITLIITLISVAIELVLGMLLALLMHRTLFGRGTVRTAILVPYGIVTVVAAFSWQYAWTPSTGYLTALIGNGTSAPLTHTVQAIAIIILAEVWKTTPFMALLLLTGLQTVPNSLIEAARMDGAKGWITFWYIRLPLLMPTLLIAGLFRALDAFRVFDLVYVLTGGGPADSTETLSTLSYKVLFSTLQFGYGSAVSTAMFVTEGLIALVFCLYLVRQIRRTG